MWLASYGHSGKLAATVIAYSGGFGCWRYRERFGRSVISTDLRQSRPLSCSSEYFFFKLCVCRVAGEWRGDQYRSQTIGLQSARPSSRNRRRLQPQVIQYWVRQSTLWLAKKLMCIFFNVLVFYGKEEDRIDPPILRLSGHFSALICYDSFN